MKTVNRGDWLYSFDLKSAFHHVNIHESHQKYLGFEAVLGDSKRWFKFKAMPFGYLDTSHVITNVLRVPVHHWRPEGKPVYVHIDDGLGVASNKKEAEEAVKVIKNDLEKLGLITSEPKCQWDTSTFRV
jgi:hypothetical protein